MEERKNAYIIHYYCFYCPYTHHHKINKKHFRAAFEPISAGVLVSSTAVFTHDFYQLVSTVFISTFLSFILAHINYVALLGNCEPTLQMKQTNIY
jgi:hypothetical protein